MQEITLRYPKELRRLWHAGKLHEAWFWEYTGLFDKNDLDNARGQCRMHHKGYHFGEWFTAIHFFKNGYGVLTEKYALPSRRDKRRILVKFTGKKGLELLTDGRLNLPDLFVYDPGNKVFFFVEVKLESDRLKPEQERSFSKLERELSCQVVIAKLNAC
jgi:hypothetical protein